MVEFEKELLDYMDLPSVPKKEWDGKSDFDKGVAVVEQRSGREAYAVAVFHSEKHSEPQIKKSFGFEPFGKILRIFIVPNYMNTNLEDADLDEASKKKAEEIINEAKEIENEGVEDLSMPKEEWVFPEIKSKEQAIAWLQAYNSRNKIRGKVPTNSDTIKLRLYSIYKDNHKK